MRVAVLGIGLLLLAACGGSGSARVASPAATVTGTAGRTTDAATVVAALKAAGVPIGAVQVYTAANDPNSLLGRPGQYTSKASFTLTTIPAEKQNASDQFDVQNGGSVEVFGSAADAQRRDRYVATVTASVPMLVEYDTVQGTVLLRLSGALTPDQAKQYQQALP